MTITLQPAVRRRTMTALFAGVASTNLAMATATTAGGLIAAGYGSGWSGVPSTAGVLGTALGALWSGRLVARLGRHLSLRATYGVGAAGGAVAFAGAALESLPLLIAGILLLGVGNGGATLSRYTASVLYPEGRRGFALSVVVWAGTVGGLVGPTLMAPASELATRLDVPSLAGPLGLTALGVAAALATAFTLPVMLPSAEPRTEIPLWTALRAPELRVPLAAMTAAQVAMVAVMTMTGPHLHLAGHGLDVVGWTISLHIAGMFALSPVTGRIADRWGGRATILAGIGTLVCSSVVLVSTPDAHTSGVPAALFLLGYGWNLVFVGSSRLLSGADQRVQGGVDAAVWATSALAGLTAGPLFGLGGIVLVAVVAGVAVLLPLALMGRQGATSE
ncbi:MFS transporter [Amycolatopsis suaedae]|uniref:MFS transporter n=1 Tax=Amycolatopsis suaedae TaxID=2510978 RepID=A0A4Q7JEL5_9PSEU|nr:MFS transporter [Amycolatopsis suaedae]RZQ65173.1 MFS transporter [Amycolatopsis suaedae]